MRHKLFLFAGLAASLNAVSIKAAVITWTNINGGAWSAPLNWSTHTVPGAADSAFINAAGTYTVTVDTPITINSLTLGGGSGQQILTNFNQTVAVNSTLVSSGGVLSLGSSSMWSGGQLSDQGIVNWSGGTLSAPLAVSVSGILNINGAGVIVQNTLTNAGTINWSGTSSSIALYNNHSQYAGFVYNEAGAIFNIQNDLNVGCACYGFESIVNAGTVRKSAGVGATSFSVVFTNYGLIDAQSGSINFTGNGNIGGSYNTASNTFIQFTYGNFVETGTVTNTGSGTFRQNGANVTLNERITKFILLSGNVSLSPTFQGTGAIQNLQLDGAFLVGTNVVSGTLGIDGGGVGPGGALTVNPSGVLLFNGAALSIYCAVTNLGTVNWSGGTVTLANNGSFYTGVIYNQPGALFNIQNDASVAGAGYGVQESFKNNGTVRKTAGLGATTFTVSFVNAGLVDAQSGTIQFGGGGNIGGSYNTASGAVIQFYYNNFTQSGPVTVTGPGICQQNGATVTLNDQIANFNLLSGNVVLSPTFQTNGAVQSLQLHGAYLTGTNVVTGTLGFDGGGLAAASPLTISNNAVLNFNGAAVTIYSPITNLGTINWSGNSISIANNGTSYTGVIYNQPGGLMNLLSDQDLNSAAYGREFFSNAGTVRKTAGLGVSNFSITTTNTGLFDVQSGAIHFNSGGSIAGSYNTASGAVIEFDAGNFFESGAVTVSGSGICRLNGATITLSDQIANLNLLSGNVVLSPTFQTNGTVQSLQLHGAYLTGTNVVTGTLGFDGGGLAAASQLTISNNAVLNFNGAAVSIYSPITNLGTINWSGASVSIANNGTSYTGVIYNRPGGLMNLLGDQNLNSAAYGQEFFSNAGTVRKTAGLGVSNFSITTTNTGLFDVQSGAIHFNSGGSIAGSYNTASGAVIEFDAGNFFESGAVTVSGSGICRLNGAMLTLNDRIANFILASGNVALSPTFQSGGAIQSLQLDGAYLTGANRVTGTLGFNGGGLASGSPLTVMASGALNLNGASVTLYAPLTNSGTINWSSGAVAIANNAAAYTGILYNQNLLNLQCDQNLNSAQYGFESFVNTGTVRKTAGRGTTSIGVPFSNTGTLDAQSGTIRITAPYSQSGGTMNFGITSLAYFGQIAFNNVAPLTGTLSVNFNGGYLPSAGDSFPLVSYSSRSGIFTALVLPAQAQWQTNYSASTFTLSVLSASNVLPVTLTPISYAAGTYTLQIDGSAGPSYILLASTNFIDWLALSTNTPVSMPFVTSDPSAGQFKRRFYRAQVGP